MYELPALSSDPTPEHTAAIQQAHTMIHGGVTKIHEALTTAQNILPYIASESVVASMQTSIASLKDKLATYTTMADTVSDISSSIIENMSVLAAAPHIPVEQTVRFDALEGQRLPDFSTIDFPGIGPVHVTTSTYSGVRVKDGVLSSADNGMGTIALRFQNGPVFVQNVGLTHFDGYHGFGRFTASLNGQVVIDKNGIQPHERIIIDQEVDSIVLISPADNGFRDYTRLMVSGISDIHIVSSQEAFAESRIQSARDSILVHPDVGAAFGALSPQQLMRDFSDFLPENGTYPQGLPSPVGRFRGDINASMNAGLTNAIMSAMRSVDPHSFVVPSGHEVRQRYPNLSSNDAEWRASAFKDEVQRRSRIAIDYVLAAFNDDIPGMQTFYAEFAKPLPGNLGQEIAASFPRTSAFLTAAYTVLVTPELCVHIDNSVAAQNDAEQAELIRQLGPSYAGGGSSVTLQNASMAGLLHNRQIVVSQHGEGSAQVLAYDTTWGTSATTVLVGAPEDDRNAGRNIRLAKAAMDYGTNTFVRAILVQRNGGNTTVATTQQTAMTPTAADQAIEDITEEQKELEDLLADTNGEVVKTEVLAANFQWIQGNGYEQQLKTYLSNPSPSALEKAWGIMNTNIDFLHIDERATNLMQRLDVLIAQKQQEIASAQSGPELAKLYVQAGALQDLRTLCLIIRELNPSTSAELAVEALSGYIGGKVLMVGGKLIARVVPVHEVVNALMHALGIGASEGAEAAIGRVTNIATSKIDNISASEAQIGSQIDDLINQGKVVINEALEELITIDGRTFTYHAYFYRMPERGFTLKNVDDAIKFGQKILDPTEDRTRHILNIGERTIRVITKKSGIILSVMEN